jgi:transposase-like protein
MPNSLKEQLSNVKLGNLSKRHKKNAVWPLEKKIEVVSKYLVLGNMKLVSVDTGVDYGLLRQWKMQPWWKDLELEIRATQNIAVDNKLSRIIERAMDVTLDRLENGEIVFNRKTGELDRVPVSMKDANKVTTDLMTKQHALRKEESAQPQTSQQSVTEQLKTLAMEFAKWAEAKQKPIDVETIEIVQNVPDEPDSSLE